MSTNLTKEFTVDINGTEITLSPNNTIEGRLKLMCAEHGRVFTRERLCGKLQILKERVVKMSKDLMTHRKKRKKCVVLFKKHLYPQCAL